MQIAQGEALRFKIIGFGLETEAMMFAGSGHGFARELRFWEISLLKSVFRIHRTFQYGSRKASTLPRNFLKFAILSFGC